MNTISIELAGKILAWCRKNPPFRISSSFHPNVKLARRLPRDDADVREHFMSQYGFKDITLSEEGDVVVLEHAATLEIKRANVLVERATAAETAKASTDVEAPSAVGDDEEDSDIGGDTSSDSHNPGEPADTSLPWLLCDPIEVKTRLAGAACRAAGRKRLLEQLLKSPHRRLLPATQQVVDALRRIEADFPNFAAAISVYARHLQLLVRTGSAIHLPASVLVGPPGIGKTRFVQAMAEALGSSLSVTSLADSTGSFVLTGSNEGWGAANIGAFARAAVECPNPGAPLILLDELDKVRSGGHWSLDTALLTFLEPLSASHYRDEFVDVSMDLRPITVLCTANRVSDLRPEIVSRLRLIDISPPSPTQKPAIVRSIDATIRRENPRLAECFLPLDPTVISSLVDGSPRETLRRLTNGYGVALERVGASTGMIEVTPADVSDIDLVTTSSKRPLTWTVTPRGPQWTH